MPGRRLLAVERMEADLVPTPSVDSLFAALADARRRQVLSLTGTRPDQTDVDALARSIVRLEREGRATEPTPEAVRSVAVALHHVHLPKLSAAGLLEYDADAGSVSRNALPEQFESMVATAAGTGREVKPE